MMIRFVTGLQFTGALTVVLLLGIALSGCKPQPNLSEPIARPPDIPALPEPELEVSPEPEATTEAETGEEPEKKPEQPQPGCETEGSEKSADCPPDTPAEPEKNDRSLDAPEAP